MDGIRKEGCIPEIRVGWNGMVNKVFFFGSKADDVMVYHSGPSWECSVIFLFLHAQDTNINIPKPISSTPTNQPTKRKKKL